MSLSRKVFYLCFKQSSASCVRNHGFDQMGHFHRNANSSYLHTCMRKLHLVRPTDSPKCLAGRGRKAGYSTKNGKESGLLFRQLLDYRSYTYSYLLADQKCRTAVLIDPVIDMVDRDVSLVKNLDLNLKYVVNTHVHADHITGSGQLKQRVSGCRSLISRVSGAKADGLLDEGDAIQFGAFHLDCFNTPGHTDGCMSFVLRSEGMVFTGDALLIRGCGRTDFQQGDAGRLYDSVHSKILSLPPSFVVYPAHDYTGQMSSTVGEESKHNQRLTKSREEFIKIMKNLNLPYPKQIDEALPANLVCGIQDQL